MQLAHVCHTRSLRFDLSLSVCPITTVDSSAAKVWSLLAKPARYAEWWDATTDCVLPPGPVQLGQQIIAHSRAFGRRWPIRIRVVGVNASRRELDLRTSLPLGITILNHIVVAPVGGGSSRVSFG